MQLYWILLWILIISAVSFVGSYYVKKHQRPDAIIGLFVAFVCKVLNNHTMIKYEGAKKENTILFCVLLFAIILVLLRK